MMEPDRPLTAIRLPLQIGTSALWSLARSSAVFPGLVLCILGAWLCIELIDWDRVGLAAGGVVAITGGILVFYGWRHWRLAMAERPSDAVLDASGLRIEGGRRHGLTLAWADIAPDRCQIQHDRDKRYILWRVIANVPLMAVSALVEDSVMIRFTEETPVKRLHVAGKGGSVLVAEADLELEVASLLALDRTIRASRWYGKQPPALPNPSRLACPGCNAAIAPTAEPSPTCRFCGVALAIPDDIRERVAAASSLVASRRSGLPRLDRLLRSQPSARRASIAMWLAALPIVLAWPAAGVLVFREASHHTLNLVRFGALTALPLLVTIGTFLLARGRLTDRFAFHAVVIGFGARDPARPGEPYRCRSCQAPLPDAAQSPIVTCVYCNAASVLGLDLRGDADEAESEQASLELALGRRRRERWLWTLASLASIGLLAGAVLIARRALQL
jgi:hypothetical protein